MCVITAAVAGSAAMATAANASLALTALGAGMQAYGMYQQGQAREKAAEYNAAVASNNMVLAERQAEDATKRGKIEEQRHRMQVGRLKADQRSALAASGIDVASGSALDVLEDTAKLGEWDALQIRANADREAYGYRAQGMNYQAEAGLQTMKGRQASRAGMIGAGSSLLTGAGNVAGSWYKFSGG